MTKSDERASAGNSAKNSARSTKRGEVPTGRTIGQAVSDAYARETRIEVDRLKSELGVREPTRIEPAARIRRRREPDPRKVRISVLKARGLDGPTICRALDASGRKELEPLDSWIEATGIRLWVKLWWCEDRKIRNRVRTYVHSVPPFESH
jgi:hypothetical protein